MKLWKNLTTVWATILLLMATISLGFTLVGTLQTFTMLHETAFSLDTNGGSEALPKSLLGVHKITCVGDSITQGEGRGYVTILSEYLKILYPTASITVENMGVPGSTSADLLKSFQKDAIEHHPDLITISIGVNDVRLHKGALTPGEFEANLSRLLDLAEKSKIPVLLMTPTPVGEDLESRQNKRVAEYGQALKHLALTRHVSFIDNFATFSSMISTYRDSAQACDNLLTQDGIHPNRLGHRVIANRLMMYLGIPSSARLRVKPDVMTELKN